MKWNFLYKLQLPPEPLTRGLPPTDPRSLCPLSSTEFVEPPPPPNKIPGYAIGRKVRKGSSLCVCFMNHLHIAMHVSCWKSFEFSSANKYVYGRIVLEKLTVPQPVEKFSAFCGNRRFIAGIARDGHPCPSPEPVQSSPRPSADRRWWNYVVTYILWYRLG